MFFLSFLLITSKPKSLVDTLKNTALEEMQKVLINQKFYHWNQAETTKRRLKINLKTSKELKSWREFSFPW